MQDESMRVLCLEARDRLKKRQRLKKAHYDAVKQSDIPEDSKRKILERHHMLVLEMAKLYPQNLSEWDREYLAEKADIKIDVKSEAGRKKSWMNDRNNMFPKVKVK